MTTTVQQLLDRAVAWSSANGLTSLTGDTAEIINRVAADERSLFDLATRVNRSYFARTQSVTSTSAGSGRTIALTGGDFTANPVGRILEFKLSDGRIVSQVDALDLDAELAPRYYVLAKTIYEVSNDWSTSSGAVTGTLMYVKRPATLSTTGALTQTVTLDDDFADILELRLARYLVQKDYGREGAEYERLGVMISEREQDFTSFLEQYGGVEARRFLMPQTGTKA